MCVNEKLTNSSMTEFKSTSKWLSVTLFVGVWTFVALVFAALTYASEMGEGRQLGLGFALRMNFARFYLWGGLSLLIFRFSYRFPVGFRPLRLRNLLLHIPAIFLFSSIHQGIHLAMGWFTVPYFKQRFASFAELFQAYFAGGLYIGLIVASLIVITAHAFLYYRSYLAGEVKRSALEAQLAQSQLQALKMQLHPHFLFNTLHSISSLVLEDPPRANSMIARLGDFLRLTLDHSEQQMVMLKQEIEFLRCYLEIEQVRFEDRLTVDFKIEPTTLSAHVPHLILQPLVENAIRHAIAPHAAPGCIKIEAKRSDGLLHLEIKDSGPGLNGASLNVQGVGLKNVQNRLKQIYGDQFRFDMVDRPEGGLTVVLDLPFWSESSEHPVGC